MFREGLNGYSGTQDNSLFQGLGRENNTNGGHPFLYTGVIRTGPDRRRALIRFDISSLSPEATILGVELRLTIERVRTGNEPHGLHRLEKGWGEGVKDSLAPFLNNGGQGAPADLGDASWNSNRHNQSAWTTPGGDFIAAPSATGILSMSGTTAILSSQGMIDDLQKWVEDPATNFGWILIGNEAQSWNAKRIYSSEGTAALRPSLTVQHAILPAAAKHWKSYE